ncbi:Rossmann-fold NAD(P)-binding domain-containing protein [Virgibacillus senegalensis]|uniref:hypothetical protein n=1 Tax=Virgibacillus senegalensis TaxID=1499679 RepID=UPI00069E293E|nr:hypothetical protein [Virgibacillus senegalensis]
MKKSVQPTVALTDPYSISTKRILAILDKQYKIIRLSSKKKPNGQVKNIPWYEYNLFDPTSIETGLADVDIAVFFYPVEFPEARLSQASLPNMAALTADSFARAARKTGIKKIIYIKPDVRSSTFAASLTEVEKALAASTIPIKTITIPWTRSEMEKRVSVSTGGVRSIQRVLLPPTKDAKWAARYYFDWLGQAGRPLFRTESTGSICKVYTRFLKSPLLVLQLSKKSDGWRTIYRITGGILAKVNDKQSKMEFCTLPESNHCLVSIHDYHPSLPWFFYKNSQAIIHLLVMHLFGKHLERKQKESAPFLL